MFTARTPARAFNSSVIAAIAAYAIGLAGCGSSTSTVTSPSTLSKCSVTFDTQVPTVGAAGGNGSVTVKTERECQWTAQPDVAWLSITGSSSGQGDGAVQFRAAANADPVARTGGIMVNGQRAQVAQEAAECRFELGSPSASLPQTGSTGSIEVHASSSLCKWTASSSANWIAVTTASGTGNGTVGFTVAPTTGPTRSGTITIAGQSFTVTQSPGCAFDVSPLSHTVDQSGGPRTVNVTAGAGCAWTASSAEPWITLASGASGSGSGTVTLAVAATGGPPRWGTVSVAGQTVIITQGSGCTVGLSPDSQSMPSSGGSGTVAVSAGAGCAWTAVSTASWITVSSGSSGSGNGTVAFKVDATTGPGRTGAITIAGRTFTVNQGQGCTFSLPAGAATASAGGATGTFDVRTSDGCGWAAASNVGWVTITSGTTGSGNGSVGYTVAPNTGAQRTGTITAAGQPFSIVQDAGCSYSIAPPSQNVGSAGGPVSVAVTAPGGCAWTASSSAGWIGISSGASGSGNGTVQLVVAANADPERRGTVTIGGQTFTIVQASGCTYSLAPADQTVPAAGGSGSFNVTATGTCAWTATASAPWIGITSGASGSGPGTVQFSVALNPSAARTGTIIVGGQTFTINQESGCAATVAPDTIAEPAAGGSQTVNVTIAAGCAWTASSGAAWVTITVGASGSGNGTSQLDIQANTGPARAGLATVAGKPVTINQESGCTFTVAPASQSAPVGGGSGTTTVTTGAGCAWTAVSNVAWITISSGASGTGSGSVQVTVDANATGATRTGTITIANQTYTINQAGQ